MAALVIRPAVHEDLDAFFIYLNDHLRDNGVGSTALFMPMARGASRFPPEREAAFRKGIATPVGQPGWRRLWLAFDGDGGIAGHVDLRARQEPAAAHRCLLGIGVHRAARKQGLGARLIGAAVAWAGGAGLAWIDLEVLSVNTAARALYLGQQFCTVGELPDLFRIDGESLAYTLMSRRIGEH